MAKARRIYYGWGLVGTLGLTEMTSWGVLYYAFGVFLVPMEQELGWSRAAMAGAFSLTLLLSGIAAVPVGRWVDRHGPRLLMTVGSVLATLLVLAWSTVTNIVVFYLIWAAIGMVTAAVLYEPAFVVVANWFERRRDAALTLLTFLGGLASVVYIPLAEWLIQGYGWRSALVLLAAILGIGTIPLHALVLRRRPADLGLLPDGATVARVNAPARPDARPAPDHTAREALLDSSFWWLTAAFALVTMASVAVSVHFVPYLIDRGFSSTFAATMAGLIGVMALPGRLIFTPLGTWLPRRLISAGIFLCQTVALVVLVMMPTQLGVILFVVLFGAGFGAVSPARAALVAELYGPRAYGSISSVLTAWSSGARALGPVGAGLLFSRFGSYVPVFWTLVALSAGSILAVLQLRNTHTPAVVVDAEQMPGGIS